MWLQCSFKVGDDTIIQTQTNVACILKLQKPLSLLIKKPNSLKFLLKMLFTDKTKNIVQVSLTKQPKLGFMKTPIITLVTNMVYDILKLKQMTNLKNMTTLQIMESMKQQQNKCLDQL